MAEFLIPLKDLEKSGKDYAFRVVAAWATPALEGSELRFDESKGPGELTVHAQKTGNDVLVQGRLTGHLLAECSRCLGDVPLDVDQEVVALFQPKASEVQDVADEEEFDEDQMDVETYSGDRVVLDDLIRETFLLEMPMQPLCSEDCKGIPIPEHIRPPADFGRESTVDPRLQPLLAIAQQVSKSKKE